ncbi:fatty acid hydroxylase domain-containing protein 2-like [Dermacentor andersoni]|uniref:fatty acid hydroxylase domain-containing protein 2-like n=1 Tax=Dermacentor andersoni TaxID=34620 RepID=UPI003B3B506F
MTVVARAADRAGRRQRYVILGSLLTWAALLAFAYVWSPSIVRLTKSSGEALRETLDLNFKKIVYVFQGDYFILTAGGQWVLTVGSYWFLGLLFLVADTSKAFSWMRRYKVQATETKPTAQSLVPVVRQVVFNQVFVQLPINVLFYWVKDLRGFDQSLSLPPLSRAVAHFACFVAIEEALFYYSHRLLHHRLLYQRFHKKHHEWTAPVAITAVYCTPVEHLLSNVLPVVVGPVVLGSHLSVHWLWAVLTAPYGVIVHSGYHLPLLPSPQMHDFHHLTFRGNYGILGILDWLHGTDRAFRQSEAFQRHRVLLSLRPVHELYPDTGAARRDSRGEGRSATQPHG